jgi:ABC-2 type transport system permease protein
MIGIALSLAGASLRGQMEYRSQFLTMVLMGLVYQGTGFVFIWVVVSRFEALAGWTLGEVAFLYALRLLSHAVYGLLFNGTARVYWLVKQGEFDRYLVRPLPALAQVMFERVHVAGLGDLLGGLVMLAVTARLVPVDWSVLALGYLVLAVVGGALVEGAVRLAGAALSFRVTNLQSLNMLLDNLFSTFGSYPLGIYTTGVRALLTFVVPVAFVAYVPAAVLLGRADELGVRPEVAYGAPLAGLCLFVLAHRFWRWQIGYYQSAGH